MFIRPWDEHSKRLLDQLVKDGRAWTDDIKISRKFGLRHPELEKFDFMDISRTDRKKKTWFVTYPNVRIKPDKHGLYEFYKIW